MWACDLGYFGILANTHVAPAARRGALLRGPEQEVRAALGSMVADSRGHGSRCEAADDARISRTREGGRWGVAPWGGRAGPWEASMVAPARPLRHRGYTPGWQPGPGGRLAFRFSLSERGKSGPGVTALGGGHSRRPQLRQSTIEIGGIAGLGLPPGLRLSGECAASSGFMREGGIGLQHNDGPGSAASF